MEPGLQVGDRVVVSRLDYRFGPCSAATSLSSTASVSSPNPSPRTGSCPGSARTVADVVGRPVGETDFVERVVGVAGDHVVCCDDAGHVTVNGHALNERYVYPGDLPSELRFDVAVPAGSLDDRRPPQQFGRLRITSATQAAAWCPSAASFGAVVAVWAAGPRPPGRPSATSFVRLRTVEQDGRRDRDRTTAARRLESLP